MKPSTLFYSSRAALLAICFSLGTLAILMISIPLLCSQLNIAEQRVRERVAVIKERTDKTWNDLMDIGRTNGRSARSSSGGPSSYMNMNGMHNGMNLGAGITGGTALNDGTATDTPQGCSSCLKLMCEPGPRGKPGERGEDGLDGKDGKLVSVSGNGSPGKNGKPGLDVQLDPQPENACLVCPAGPPGPRGPQGERGRPGYKGGTGHPGIPGRPGKVGIPGLPGGPGKKGNPGDPGLIGLPGDDVMGGIGTKGLPGKRGNPGIKGPPGPPGKPSTDGGSSGRRGRDGAQGRDGDRGPPGPDGPWGPTGVPGPPASLCMTDCGTSTVVQPPTGNGSPSNGNRRPGSGRPQQRPTGYGG